MDSRVILATLQHDNALALPELDAAREARPTLPWNGPVTATATVSLIVPTFFNAELKRGSLPRLLAGIEESCAVKEIIVVSSDGEGRSFEELKSGTGERLLRAIESDPNNRGRSRNAGAAAATGDYLLYLDDDMLLKNWRFIDVVLSKMLSDGFQCAMFPPRQYARFPLLYDAACLDKVIRVWRRGARDPFLFDPLRQGSRDLPMLFCFPGCFTLIARAAYEALSGFDEAFEGWGFEDTDFAFRVIRNLRVLNLFTKAEPLLHIDHPVSPYKSEEHRANGKKFFRSASPVDVHAFCRSVFSGQDFVLTEMLDERREFFREPYRTLSQHMPVDLAELEPWAAAVANQRLRGFMKPTPEFLLLHGSRSTGSSTEASDYDVLCLFRGPVQDFFVTRGQPAIEIECSYLEQFEAIVAAPCQFGTQGVFEIAKIAKAKLLAGDDSQFQSWRQSLLKSTESARPYWLVLACACAQSTRLSPTLLFESLAAILRGAGYHDNAEALAVGDVAALRRYAAEALDCTHPEWRLNTLGGERVFPFQVPELWPELRRLASDESRRGQRASEIAAAQP
jgi:glycosyltransferase involved in cell wall biosynthesis